MEKNEIKEILGKQLELLSEISETAFQGNNEEFFLDVNAAICETARLLLPVSLEADIETAQKFKAV